MYGGLIVAITLIAFSPVVSGKRDPANPERNLSMITDPSIDFQWFPLDNPGIVSIPLAFLLGWLGTVTSKERSSREKYAEMEVRSLTGAGAEKASVH
jgi:cation/acetate symporter